MYYIYTHFNYPIIVSECGQGKDAFQYKNQTKNGIRLILNFCKTSSNYAQLRGKYILPMYGSLIQ